ncbi:MAG: chorismate synthase [Candidatus Delongbacteria bacterium]
MKWLSAGESHGPAMGIILEGLPAGLPLGAARIDHELHRRQQGHGRGGRMAIEQDQVEILAGLRHGLTLGSPLHLLVRNRDHANWAQAMQAEPVDGPGAGVEVRVPRPGHADLPGALKYGHRDLRNVLERASARETVNRVLAGAVALQLLEPMGICVAGFVHALGGVVAGARPGFEEDPRELVRRADASPVRCLDPDAEAEMIRVIDAAHAAGDTLGGVVELRATGLPAGLGSHVHWERRLDGRLGAALLSLPAVKGLELGDAFAQSALGGQAALDPLRPAAGTPPLSRQGNRHGGLDGGMSTGETLWLRLAMKPLSTLRRPLPSVNLTSLEACSAHRERSDVCALPALAVVAEHVLAWELARAVLETFGADTWEETQHRYARRDERWERILGPGTC